MKYLMIFLSFFAIFLSQIMNAGCGASTDRGPSAPAVAEPAPAVVEPAEPYYELVSYYHKRPGSPVNISAILAEQSNKILQNAHRVGVVSRYRVYCVDTPTLRRLAEDLALLHVEESIKQADDSDIYLFFLSVRARYLGFYSLANKYEEYYSGRTIYSRGYNEEDFFLFSEVFTRVKIPLTLVLHFTPPLPEDGKTEVEASELLSICADFYFVSINEEMPKAVDAITQHQREETDERISLLMRNAGKLGLFQLVGLYRTILQTRI
jgi:hypothetical protein